jgi:LmbE family N-acetylglucosaminyl deacetylase
MSHAIFISPHLDDAALSCGGGIARLAGSGTQVTIVTVCTADQPPGAPLSRVARRVHASWCAGERPFEARRAEDLQAARILGAKADHLGLLDAIYRRSEVGAPLYADSINAPVPSDVERFLPRLIALLQDSLAAIDEGDRVFCPVGTGGHVDHVLTRMAVEQVADRDAIVYYDEYPYVTRSGPSPMSRACGVAIHTLVLAPAELDVRIAAIGCYASQLRGLFPSQSQRLAEIALNRIPALGARLLRPPDPKASGERMAAQVRRDTANLGGERYWWPAAPASSFPPG